MRHPFFNAILLLFAGCPLWWSHAALAIEACEMCTSDSNCEQVCVEADGMSSCGEFGVCDDGNGGSSDGNGGGGNNDPACDITCSWSKSCGLPCTDVWADNCGDFGVCNEMCSNICGSNTTCNTDCIGTGEVSGWTHCLEGSNQVCSNECSNTDHCTYTSAPNKACYLNSGQGSADATCASSGNPNNQACSLTCDASSPCPPVGLNCWKDGAYQSCGQAGETCNQSCDLLCTDSTACGTPCWADGNYTSCGAAAEACIQSCDNGYCDASKACTQGCWLDGAYTNCGTTGNFCGDDCRVKCNLGSGCASGGESCWYDGSSAHYCSEFVGDETGFACGTCGNLCEWDTACNSPCMMMGGNETEGNTDTDWNNANLPANSGSEQYDTDYFMTTCHDFGKCQQCATICEREVGLESVASSTHNGLTYTQLAVEDATGLPYTGALRVGDQIVNYISHDNKAGGEDEGIIYLPSHHTGVSNSSVDTIYPLRVESTVHHAALSGVTELWLADTRAFPQQGTVWLNPNCGNNCNAESKSFQIGNRGVPGTLILTSGTTHPHNLGEPVFLLKDVPSAPTACETLCADGNKPSSCGAYAMCASCPDTDVCHADAACDRACWYNGEGYVGDVDGDLDNATQDPDWLNSCGEYSETNNEVLCQECESTLCSSLCDEMVGDADSCATACLKEEDNNYFNSTCQAAGYAPDCNDVCGTDADCGWSCDNGGESLTTCGEFGSCQSCLNVCNAFAFCDERCLFESESTTCAGAILADVSNGSANELNCLTNPSFWGNAPEPITSGIGGLVTDCGPEPQGSCGCEMQWQGGDSYAQCARQGTEALGDDSAGLDGTWWLSGKLSKDDQFFNAGVLGRVYVLGEVIGGSTNANSVFHGANAPDVTVQNEPPSTTHLFLLAEPSLADCGEDFGGNGEKSSGLFFRWKSDIYPVARFGLCSRFQLDSGSGDSFLNWPDHGLRGFALPSFSMTGVGDADLNPFRGLRAGLNLSSLQVPSNLMKINTTLPHISIDLGSGLPNFGDWDGIDLGTWGVGSGVAFPGITIPSFGLLDNTDFSCSGTPESPCGNMCAWAPGNNCEFSWTNYQLPRIQLGNADFDKMGILLKTPHLANLLRLSLGDATAILTSVPINSLGWPQLHLAPEFNSMSFGSSGLPFRLPDFRIDVATPEFFRTFPGLSGFYDYFITFSPPSFGFGDEADFTGQSYDCGFRVILHHLDSHFTTFPAVAKDYPGLVDKFQILLMAFANARYMISESGAAIADSPFASQLYDNVNDVWTEKYRQAGPDGFYGTEDDIQFVGTLFDTLSSWTGNASAEFPNGQPMCPGFNGSISGWSALLNYLNTFHSGEGSILSGWPDPNWAIPGLDGFSFNVNLFNELPDIFFEFHGPTLSCGSDLCRQCLDDNSGNACLIKFGGAGEWHLTSYGAERFLQFLKNAWRINNISNRRVMNSLLGALTIPDINHLNLNGAGLPHLNAPHFDKFLSAASFACNPLVPAPHENNDDAWAGSDMGSSDYDGYDGGWGDDMQFTRTYSLLGVDYIIDLEVGLDSDYQIKGAMSPAFIAANADVGSGVNVDCSIELTNLNFYGIKISIGVSASGDVATAGVEGKFDSGWDRQKINVDLTGTMDLTGPNIDIAGFVSVKIPIVGGGKWTSPATSLANNATLVVPLFDIHHSRDNPMVALFEKYQMPPSMCSLLENVALSDDPIDMDSDLVDTPVYHSPCDLDGDDVINAITSENLDTYPDVICADSANPMHWPPETICVPNEAGAMVNRLVYRGQDDSDSNYVAWTGACFDSGGDIGCDYTESLEIIPCGSGEVCEAGECKPQSFNEDACQNPCAPGQSNYCQICSCDQGSEGRNPCVEAPSYCNDSLTLRMGRTPGLCQLAFVCDGQGVLIDGTFVSAGTTCMPGSNTCGLGGACVQDDSGPAHACTYVWENVNCGAIGKKCVERGTDNVIDGSIESCQGEDCRASCVACTQDSDCGETGSMWVCSEEGNCVNSYSEGAECYVDSDCSGTSQACENHQCVADTTPPDTLITARPQGDEIDATSVTFAFSCTDNVHCSGVYQCKLDAGAWENCDSGTVTYNNLGDGLHTFQVKAKDGRSADANWDPSPAVFYWQSRICSCTNGAGTTGAACPDVGVNTCASCHDGFHLDGSTCVDNVCACPNGTAATGTACHTHSATICQSCAGNYHLENEAYDCQDHMGDPNACLTHPQCQVAADLCVCAEDGTQASGCTGGDGPTCEANTCTCNGGIAATGDDCTTHEANICTSCSSGYYASGQSCLPNACFCINGQESQGSACPFNGATSCASCEVGYRLVNNYCVANVCLCANGTPASGSECDTHGEMKCASCFDGYYLNAGGGSEGNNGLGPGSGSAGGNNAGAGDGDELGSNDGPQGPQDPIDPPSQSDEHTCLLKVCTCPANGTGATGVDCPNHGDQKCGDCEAGFHLNGNTCAGNSCTCQNGTAATGTDCTTNGANLCTSCDTDWYINEANQCVDTMSCICPNGTAATVAGGGGSPGQTCEPTWWPEGLRGALTEVQKEELAGFLQHGEDVGGDYKKASDYLKVLVTDDANNEVAKMLFAAVLYLNGDIPTGDIWLLDLGVSDLGPTLKQRVTAGLLLQDLLDYLQCDDLGSGTDDPVCEQNGDLLCVACDEGYYLKNDSCHENRCECTNGVPALGMPNCPINEEMGCDSCTPPPSGIPNYAGIACDEDIDECGSGTHNCEGTCTNLYGSFECGCAAGYELEPNGTTCSDINECEELNGGCQENCNNTIGSYECSCPDGFTVNPDDPRGCLEINECEGVNCHKGTCKDLKNDYVCICDPGWEGEHCDINPDDCEGNPCNNGGTCVDGIGEFTCDCLPGFNGDVCQYDINECDPNPCLNGGSCSEGAPGAYTCSCFAGYEGDDCETNIDDCSPNPCQNEGYCEDQVNGFLCVCAQGYEGETCGEDIDGCASAPCFDDSVSCLDVPAPGTGAECGDCPSGYHGDGITCDENQCNCAHGAGTSGLDCANHGESLCGQCYTGYHLDDGACIENICTCANGVGATGDACNAHGTVTCASCETGFHLENEQCAENVCVCANGVGATGVACENHQSAWCASCTTGHHLEAGSCTENVCTCENGVGATGADCVTHDASRCDTCSDGYHLNGNACVENICECDNGVGAVGVDCAVHAGTLCSSCADGYHLDSGSCIVNVCTCENGTAATGLDCNSHNTAACSSCTLGYQLNQNACEIVYCEADRRVEGHECIDCDLGFTNTAGDSAAGPDTFCDDCNGVNNGSAFYDNCGDCVGGTTGQSACNNDCTGAPGGDAQLDNCNVCDNDPTNDCVQDCDGNWGGEATLDNCDICDDDPANDCIQDCNGDWGGSAALDNCDACVGGNTNLTACAEDCNGEWGGTAVLDGCNVCTGGTTGQEACTQDCNNEWGGTAALDNCNNCVGGTTGVVACEQDCNGEWGGAAVLDDCNVCTGGTTGLEACAQDCNNEWGGTAELDNCNTCVGGTTGLVACIQDCSGQWGGIEVVDCAEECGGQSYEDNCGTCDDDPTNDCDVDCNGDLGGDALEDNCGTCDNDPSNDCTQDCHGDWAGSAVVDNCGNCTGGNSGAEACVQDCNDEWGGAATLDTCGVCDDNPENDCPPDCWDDAEGELQIQDMEVSGGVITLTNSASLEVPSGALADSVEISVERTQVRCVADYTLLSPLYHFGPDGLSFVEPVKVMLPFTGDVRGVGMYWSNETGGYDLLDSAVEENEDGRFVVAEVTHFSSGFVGEADWSDAGMPTTLDSGTPDPVSNVSDAGTTEGPLNPTLDAGAGTLETDAPDAGATEDPVTQTSDAGSDEPTVPAGADAGSSQPPVDPVADAGTGVETPPDDPAVDAGSGAENPPVDPVVDAGTGTENPPVGPETDAGSVPEDPAMDAGRDTPVEAVADAGESVESNLIDAGSGTEAGGLPSSDAGSMSVEGPGANNDQNPPSGGCDCDTSGGSDVLWGLLFLLFWRRKGNELRGNQSVKRKRRLRMTNILMLGATLAGLVLATACGPDFPFNTQEGSAERNGNAVAVEQEPSLAGLMANLKGSVSAKDKATLTDLLQQERYADAESLLSGLLENDSGNDVVRTLLASVHLLQGKMDLARATLTGFDRGGEALIKSLQARFEAGLLRSDLLEMLQANTGALTGASLAGLLAPSTSATQKAIDEKGPLMKEWNLNPIQEFEEPAQLAYDVQLATQLDANSQGMGDYLAQMTSHNGERPSVNMPTQHTTQTLKGKLSLDDLGRDAGNNRWMQMQWHDEGSTLEVPGYADQAKVNEAFQYGLTKELGRAPFLLKMNPQSEIEALYAHAEMSADVISRFLFLVDALYIQFPQGAMVQGPPPAWSKKEWDVSGQYQAQYQARAADNTVWKIEKSKTKYLQLPASHQPTDRLQIVESPNHISISGAMVMTWSPVTGVVTSSIGEISMHIDNKYVVTDASGKVEIVQSPRSQLANFTPVTNIADLNTYLQNFKVFPLSNELDAALLAQRKTYRQRHLTDEERGNIEANFNTFINEIAPIVGQGQNVDKKEVARIQRELADMSRANPDLMMQLFERHLKGSEYNTNLAALMIRAAVSHGGEAGEALVGRAIRHPNLRTQFRSVGVIALGKSPKLSDVGEAVLHDLVKQPYEDPTNRIVSEQACYMVANSVRRENNLEQYNRGVNLLLSELPKAQHLWRKLQLLRGLTNAGHPKVLDHIQPYLADQSKYGQYLRVAAFQSMRMNKSPEASAIYLNALLKEKSFYVKTRVVPLIADMAFTEDQRQKVSEYIEKEPKRVLVAPAILALGAHGQKAIPIIERYLNDSRDNVKQAAFEALKRAQQASQ